MDPVGPWSAAYASYTRIPGVQASTGGDIHSQHTQSGTPPTSTASILPGGFLSSTPVGYESAFSPLFQHTGSKPPVHYVPQVAQQRQPLTQTEAGAATSKQPEGEYQGQAYFEQTGGTWQQNSPFGVLPHESIVPSTTASKSTSHENFNTHFTVAQGINHLNTQLVASNSKNTVPGAQIPQAVKSTSHPSSTLYQVSATYSNADSSNSTKTFVSSDASNLQQSCIVSSSPSVSSSNEYHVPQAPNHNNFLSSATPSEKPFVTHPEKQTILQIQTKAQSKIYPDLNSQANRQRTIHHDENQTQSSSINFSLDTSVGLNYTNNSSTKRVQFQSSNYRHYQPGNNAETDFHHIKTSVEYHNSNGSDCVAPKRASPLQAHSQPSPLGHAQSPVYPMYNSPMNSSSPQQTSNSQLAPSSPLDATVSRSNSQSGSATYPSVITRALNSDKNFPDPYDKSVQQQQLQDCWERQTQSQQQIKYQTQPMGSSNYSTTNNLDMTSRISDQSQQHAVSTQEHQQAYFNNSSAHQLPLQDLSSCRGDPISLVKNVQQQSCQIQQLDIKSEPTSANRRRKNNKLQQLPSEISQGPTMTEYFAGRIPPPAHSSALTQQQNGAYFDFDRWNLPTSSKMFGSPGIHQQHQGILVTHPHGHHPPPLYFPPFHLPSQSEYPQTVELTPTVYNEQQQNQQHNQEPNQQDDQPKVVVPNIEEELGFLSGGTGTRTTKVTPNSITLTMRPPTIVNQISSTDRTTGTAGFMHSYLKFLQGDRDSSPPPAARGNRKQSWARSKPVQQTTAQINGISSTPPLPNPMPRLSQGDPQDDPRYFPLPKERKKNRFNSSDDGFSSEDDLFSKKVAFSKGDVYKERSFKKSKGARQVGSTVHRRQPRKVYRPKKEKEFNDEGKVPTVNSAEPPRRTSSRRAAKEKTNLRQMIEDDMDYLDYMDSDSDPAWSPKRNEDGSVVAVMKKGRRVRNVGGKRRPSRNLITTAAHCAGINDLDGYTSDGIKKSIALGANQEQKQNVVPILENNIATPIALKTTVPAENPFKHGEFIVVKSDLTQERPILWRVDGRALLQRYEPFEQNGQILYKNIQTYTSWSPESIKQYICVPVSYKIQTSTEVIVEFLRKEIVHDIDLTIIEKSMEKNLEYQDNFEVYIQTLISQALDKNFLTEIFQEQDEYFLSNVKTIDDITDNQKHKMIYLLQWPKVVLGAVNTWPCFNTINECGGSNAIRPCTGCLKPGVSARVLMYGQPYNITTLEDCQPDPSTVEKDFLMCQTCAKHVDLLNKVTHQKYRMYIQCAKKVEVQRNSNAKKDSTSILNELLADEDWLNKLFEEARCSWAEVDSLEYKYKLNDKCSDSSNNKTVL